MNLEAIFILHIFAEQNTHQRVIISQTGKAMIKQKDGFLGERSIVLPPMIVEMEEKDPLASSLHVTDIGYYPHASHHYCNRKEAIDQYVLIYCVDGSGWYRLGNMEYKVHKNQFFILPAGQPHCYGSSEDDEWTIYWIHFRGKNAELFAGGVDKPQEIKLAFNSRITDRHNIFEEIFHTLEQGYDIENLRYASSLLYHYLASMRYLSQYRKANRTEEENIPDVVDAAIHYMRENIENHISMQDVIRYVGYSNTQFTNLFKRQTGYSPLNYFNRLKIEYACKMLRETNMHINQICYKVGFEDSLYFSRLFSKIMGTSPTKYKESLTRE